MSRYSFHVVDGVTVPSHVGVELLTVGEALRYADRLEIAVRLSMSSDADPVTVEITDEAGTTIGCIPLGASVLRLLDSHTLHDCPRR